jgi:6-pyruvoyl tetrahydropterin synthase/QueD family protein
VVSHLYDKPNPIKGDQPQPVVDIIVPARDEEDSIGRCLQSLVSQQGIAFRITVVDDGSRDRTREIAESFAGVRVIQAEEPAAGMSGKSSALILGVRDATAPWLLFTDADTEHLPGSLAAALREAEERAVDLLSYSPEQETDTWSERALMPVVFAELARMYPPQRVNDPADPTAAANGQYILVRRTVYEALGGHHAVANNILEDVALARLFKVTGKTIWFRRGTGLVRTRMYRGFWTMCEGWTKNLTLLFPHALWLALWRAIEFAAIVGFATLGLISMVRGNYRLGLGAWAASTLIYSVFLLRIRGAHFPWAANLVSLLGLPLFAGLLARSWKLSRSGGVRWKGRSYAHFVTRQGSGSSISRRSKLEQIMVYLTRKAEFSASHFYHNPEFSAEENRRIFGKCNNPNGHGHNYTLEVTVRGQVDKRSGFVVDLKQLKEIMLREVIDVLDHRFLNKEIPEFKDQIPTTENLAISIWNRLHARLNVAKLHRVRVYETPDLFVDYYGEA